MPAYCLTEDDNDLTFDCLFAVESNADFCAADTPQWPGDCDIPFIAECAGLVCQGKIAGVDNGGFTCSAASTVAPGLGRVAPPLIHLMIHLMTSDPRTSSASALYPIHERTRCLFL